MKSFWDYDMAVEYAEAQARAMTRDYYVGQDSRTGSERWLVGTRLQYLRSRTILPARHIASPEAKGRRR